MYLGREPIAGEVTILDSIESQFNGVLTTFNLTRNYGGATVNFYPVSSEQLLVSLGGVIQKPDTTGNTGFKINVNQIIFAVAPSVGTSCFIVSYGNITDIGVPANNTVTTDKLVDGSVTPIKLSTGGPWWLSSGRVGIGTTNPATTFHVVPIGTDAAHFVSSIDTTSDGAGQSIRLLVGSNGSSSSGTIFSHYSNNSSGVKTYRNAIRLYDTAISFEDSNATRVTITSTGNVGIGTTNPFTKLDTRGALHVGGGTDGIWLGNAGDNSAYDNVKLYYTGYNSGTPRVYLTPRTQPGSGNVNTFLHLQSNVVGGPGSNTMGLLVDGSVGIGTTNPSSKLTVVDSTDSVAAVTVDISNANANNERLGLDVICTTGGAGTNVSLGLFRGTYTGYTGFEHKTLNLVTNAAQILGTSQNGYSFYNVTQFPASGSSTDFNQYYYNQYNYLNLNATLSNTGANASYPTRYFGIYSKVDAPNSENQKVYNLYLENGGTPSSTSNWAIYQYTSTTPNYFAGNVGIGLTNPTEKLSVSGAQDLITANESGSTNTWRARILSKNLLADRAAFLGTYGTSVGVFAHNHALNAWSTLFVNTTNGSADGGSVLIAGSGNVGIGTASPSLKFHVYGSNTLVRFDSSTSYVDIQLSNTTSTNGYIQYNGNDLRLFANSGSTPTLVITGGSPGTALLGTTTSRAGASRLTVCNGTNNTDADYQGSAASFVGPGTVGTSTVATTVSIEDNRAMAIDVGGSIGFGGRYLSANTSYAQWAAIAGKKETGVSNEYGGYLGLYTRTHASANIDERVRISSTGNMTINNGNLVIGTSGKGIDFSATANSSGTMTSELLADYEEGTWTPTVSSDGTPPTVSYTYRLGNYTKIGNVVYIRLAMSFNITNSGTGVVTVSLPFVAANFTQNWQHTRTGYFAGTIATEQVAPRFNDANASLYTTSGSTSDNAATTGTRLFSVNLFYFVS